MKEEENFNEILRDGNSGFANLVYGGKSAEKHIRKFDILIYSNYLCNIELTPKPKLKWQ